MSKSAFLLTLMLIIPTLGLVGCGPLGEGDDYAYTGE